MQHITHKWFLIILLFLSIGGVAQNQSNVYFEFYLDDEAFYPASLTAFTNNGQQAFTQFNNQISSLHYNDSLSISHFDLLIDGVLTKVPFNQKIEKLPNLMISFIFYESLNYQCLHYSLHDGCTIKHQQHGDECDQLLAVGTYYPQCLFSFKNKIETDCELFQFLNPGFNNCHQPASNE